MNRYPHTYLRPFKTIILLSRIAFTNKKNIDKIPLTITHKSQSYQTSININWINILKKFK